jgi:molecular chaperone DnaK
MSKEEIEKAKEEAELHAEEDKKKREQIDAKNHLENSIYHAEKMPTEYKDKISDEDKKAIEEAVKEAKKALEEAGDDKDKLEAATKELSDKIMPIGAKMYQQASGDANNGETKTHHVNADDNKDDGAVEGEVVE